MAQAVTHAPARRGRMRFTLGAAGAALVVLAVALMANLALHARQAVGPAEMPISADIEAAYGVRFKMVAVTADGGLVDLRYTVIDPAKAQTMMNSLATAPQIVKIDGSATLQLLRPMNHKNELAAGRSGYVLFVNEKSAFKSGDTVSIVVGQLRLAPVTVK